MSPAAGPLEKKALDIAVMFRRIRKAVEPYPKAAMFELADRGFNTPFQQLVACLISVRTFDEVSLPAAIRLFTRAGNAAEIGALAANEIDMLIYPATFHERKSAQIRALAKQVVEQYGGQLPCDRDLMMSFGLDFSLFKPRSKAYP